MLTSSAPTLALKSASHTRLPNRHRAGGTSSSAAMWRNNGGRSGAAHLPIMYRVTAESRPDRGRISDSQGQPAAFPLSSEQLARVRVRQDIPERDTPHSGPQPAQEHVLLMPCPAAAHHTDERGAAHHRDNRASDEQGEVGKPTQATMAAIPSPVMPAASPREPVHGAEPPFRVKSAFMVLSISRPSPEGPVQLNRRGPLSYWGYDLKNFGTRLASHTRPTSRCLPTKRGTYLIIRWPGLVGTAKRRR